MTYAEAEQAFLEGKAVGGPEDFYWTEIRLGSDGIREIRLLERDEDFHGHLVRVTDMVRALVGLCHTCGAITYRVGWKREGKNRDLQPECARCAR